MKHIAFLSLLLASTCLNAQTTWHSLAAPIRGVDMSPDGRYVVAVGDYGSILYSTDAGVSWNRDFAGSHERFEDVLITSSGRTVIVGRGGFLAVRADEAEQWERITLAPYEVKIAYRARQVGDKASLVTVLADSLLLLVDLSSRTPQQLETPRTGLPAAAWFLSRSEGLVAVAGRGLYRTTDAGAVWTEVIQDTGLVMPDLDGLENGAVIAMSSAEGWLYLSRDSGRSWTRESVDAKLSPTRVSLSGEYVGISGVPAPRPPRHGVALFSLSANSWLWQTNVVGTATTDLAIDSWGRAYAANDLSALVAFDSTGMLMYVHDPNPGEGQIVDLAGASDSVAFTRTTTSTVQRSINRGTTWNTAFGGVEIAGMHFDDQGNGLLLRSDGFWTYRTSDTGSSFMPVELTYENVDSNFPTQKNALALSSIDSQGKGYVLLTKDINPDSLYLLRTVDTLHTVSGRNIADAGFYFRHLDQRHSCVVYATLFNPHSESEGAYSIDLMRLEEQGEKVTRVVRATSLEPYDWHVWVASCDRLFRAVKLDDTVRHASPHMLMESPDGGETWRDFYRFDGPVTLSFLTDSLWIAGSNFGRIWMTTNGGATWELETIEPAPIVTYDNGFPDNHPQFHRAVLLDDSATILIRGEFGLLFRKDLESRAIGAVHSGEEPESSGTLRVLPSITMDRATLIWEDSGPHDIRVLDMLGREVAFFGTSGANRRVIVDLSSLPSGHYHVILLSPSGSVRGVAPLLIRR